MIKLINIVGKPTPVFDLCPYGLWGGKEACSNKLLCLTTGEPKCMNSLGGGETVEQYLRKHRLWKDDNQK